MTILSLCFHMENEARTPQDVSYKGTESIHEDVVLMNHRES